MGIKNFVSLLNRMNCGIAKFEVVEYRKNSFCIVGAHKYDNITFNFPISFKWDGHSFSRTTAGNPGEIYSLVEA